MKTDDLAALSLDGDGLIYQGRSYPYTSVLHLRFARTEVTTYVVPIKIGSEGSAGV